MAVSTEKYREDIEELYSSGLGRSRIVKTLNQRYGESPHPANISKAILRWGIKRENTFSDVLDDSGFIPPDNWNYGWLKTKDASIFIKNIGVDQKEIISDYVDAIKEAINNTEWSITVKQTSYDNLFVPCIFDLHLGKLAWGEETGEDYDTKIAVARFRVALTDLIEKAKGYKIERILFPVGNDIYNSDRAKPFPQTTAGTPQMDDLRWQKLFRMGIQLITEAVIQLSKLAPVDVKMVYSNHDHERVFYLGETLSAVFNNHPTVNVDNSPKMRKYYQWGECLIGLTHGHNDKSNNLPLVMAQEAKEMWGSTFYREWLLGHLHHRKQYTTDTAKDYRGVNVRYITSPSAPDAWHSERSFVGAIKGAEGFIYNKKEGIIGIVIHNIK